jgi:1-acyl-sn-glycerol-3-phosphate acyltransferase
MGKLREGFLDWIATGVSVGGVMGSLVVFDAVQRVAVLFGDKAHQRAVTGMARSCNLALRAGGIGLHPSGLENAKGGPYIIVANHQSVLDISLISGFLGHLRPRYISKRELGRGVPGISYNLRRGGSALIDRKNSGQAHKEIEALAQRIREDGWSVAIFPEGTRSKTGKMKTFREAGLRTLVTNAPGVPVLPITTSGGSRLFRKNLRPVVRGVDLGIHVHPPLLPPDPEDAEAWKGFVQELAQTIHSALPPEDLG